MMFCGPKILTALAALLLFAVWPAASARPEEGRSAFRPNREGSFPVFYNQAEIFQQAIAKAPIAGRPGRVTGLTVPHHFLAADLTAQGLAAAAGGGYSRIIILSPDHYGRGRSPFSVPGRDFSTCLGPVPLDRAAAQELLMNPLVSRSNLFSHEHGLQALLPLTAHYFPGVRILPVAISRSTEKDWDDFLESLRPLLNDRTLLIQSTDFSHYLTRAEADLKDAESAAVILSQNDQAAAALNQPAHVDSRAALYLQIKAQKQLAGRPEIASGRNSADYVAAGGPRPTETTSYLVVVYRRPPLEDRPGRAEVLCKNVKEKP